jgi:hypothetical protein
MNSIINLVNKKVLAIIVVVLLLLLGGWYLMNSNKAGTPGSTATESQGGMKSLKDLLSSGVAQKCTYSSTDEESGTSEGTSYVSGGKVRADFSTTVSGKTTISHMITDGKTSYIWTDGEKSGFKMTVPDATPTSAKTDTSNTPVSSEADLNQKVDYKCSAWVVDNSYFTPPTTVTFSDFSQMVNPAAPAGSGSSSSSQCSYCNSLSGDDKTQCLTALKCN